MSKHGFAGIVESPACDAELCSLGRRRWLGYVEENRNDFMIRLDRIIQCLQCQHAADVLADCLGVEGRAKIRPARRAVGTFAIDIADDDSHIFADLRSKFFGGCFGAMSQRLGTANKPNRSPGWWSSNSATVAATALVSAGRQRKVRDERSSLRRRTCFANRVNQIMIASEHAISHQHGDFAKALLDEMFASSIAPPVRWSRSIHGICETDQCNEP